MVGGSAGQEAELSEDSQEGHVAALRQGWGLRRNWSLGRSLQNVLPVAGRLARSAAWLSAHGDWAAAHENAFPAMAPEPVAQNGFLPPTLVTQPAVWTSTTAHRPGVQPPKILRNCSLSPRKSARRNPTKNSACVQFGRSRRDRKCLPKLGVGQRTSGWTKKGLTSIDFFKPFVTATTSPVARELMMAVSYLWRYSWTVGVDMVG